MHPDFLKPYNFKENESVIYSQWDISGYFNPDNLPGERKKAFSIVLPPPNVTGVLHMGHALNATIQDILTRYHRMKGEKTLWIPGTDHAGIATQNVVEKQLKKEGISRHDLGKEKFLEKVWEWKETYGNIILDQLKKIGASCDWSRARFTMDKQYARAVQEVFIRYHQKGWIYQGDRIVNWCTKDATSLSDLELEYKEEQGTLWYIKYPLKDGRYIIVATTRPETMLGDAAVAVHPQDERYNDFIGNTVLLPLVGREIPIIGDSSVEKEFGTGAVKVTPAHDFADAEMGERHALPIFQVINERGKMTALAGEEFENLKVIEARAKVVEKLKKAGLVEKEEPYTHSVAHCYRCDTVIEPLISKQWFLKMSELAQKAIEEVESGRVVFYPDRWKKVYLEWLSKVKDWCISRQIWWGHAVPIEGSTDVLDTWFSSALWPFATLGWPEKTKDLETFYPTSVLSTARDIINLWVARMIFSGKELMGEKPFSDVIIHATILAKDGRRMSKSLGTGIDPMTLIEKYGADATRFGLIWQAMGGQDIKWADEHVVAGQKFANKLWNIARFVLDNTNYEDFDNMESYEWNLEEEAIVNEFQLLNKINFNNKYVRKPHNKPDCEAIEKYINEYEFGQALHIAYDLIWHKFADKYIEYAKIRLRQGDQKEQKKQKAILFQSLVKIIKLLHPFMPFVTEAIYQRFPAQVKSKGLLMIEDW
ncbi:MAG: valine--tRNA ligase [Candidatus Pacebacteria bacterium]|nr:valine--tRNA ligase [Candidatus Paceibacterota bacterium]